MPIYEYVCQDCGKLNEVLQKISDPPPDKCDGCGANELTKIVSRSTFVLKGGGWYSDLYSSAKKEGPSKPAPEPKKETSTSGSSSASASSTSSSSGSAKVAASPAK